MARLFARGTDKIDVSNSGLLMPPTPQVLIAGWARFTSFAAESWLYAHYNTGVLPGVHLIRSTTGSKINGFWLNSAGSGAGPTGATTLSTNIWYHVAFAISGANAAIYSEVFVNGVVDGTNGPNATNWGQSTLVSYLGASASGATCAATLSDWAVWTGLSAGQAREAVFRVSRPGASPQEYQRGLVAHWPVVGAAANREPVYGLNGNLVPDLTLQNTVVTATVGDEGPFGRPPQRKVLVRA